MILLQAAIAAGLFLYGLFFMLLLFGVPILTKIIMRRWRKRDQQELERNFASEEINNQKLPTDWGILISSVLLSIFIVVVIFVIIVMMLNRLIPNFEGLNQSPLQNLAKI
jgi:uncharacterized protein (DUF2062 family)